MSRTSGPDPEGTPMASGLVPSNKVRTAPRRHVVGVGDGSVKPDQCRAPSASPHKGRRPGMVGASHADPRHPGLARHRDRFVRARVMTRMAMPLSPSTSAVAGALLVTRMSGCALKPPAFETPDILRQTEYAVAVGAGEIGFGHQLAQRAASLCGNPLAARQSSISERTALAGKCTIPESAIQSPLLAGCNAPPKIAAA